MMSFIREVFKDVHYSNSSLSLCFLSVLTHASVQN